jgi:hypothetical protein
MSKLAIILSFVSASDLKKIRTKISRGMLEEEDLAVELGDFLADQKDIIRIACNGRFANEPHAGKDTLYYFMRYYGCRDDRRCLYHDFEQFCKGVILTPTLQG